MPSESLLLRTGAWTLVLCGFYADVSTLQADHEYAVELRLPAMKPGQFQGLFFDNVETEYTEEIADD